MDRSARRRRTALLAFVVVSGAVHALIGGWLFGHRANSLPGPATPAPSVVVVPVPIAEGAADPSPGTQPTVDAPQRLRGVQTSASAAVTTRYFDASEVDQEAQPIPDWAIDAPGMYSVGLRRAVMQVFVSEAGQAVRCILESAEPEALMPLVKASLERQACSTPLNPAIREGKNVASVRRIELLITP